MKNQLTKTFCFLLFLISSILCYADSDKTQLLEDKKGFKCFLLGDSICHYSDQVIPVKGTVDTYGVCDSTLLKIGDDIVISHIVIKTYNDRILSISVMAKPSYKYKLQQVLVAAYGTMFTKPNQYRDQYYWISPNNLVELFLNMEDRSYVYATFKDKELDNLKAQDSNSKLNKAVNDL